MRRPKLRLLHPVRQIFVRLVVSSVQGQLPPSFPQSSPAARTDAPLGFFSAATSAKPARRIACLGGSREVWFPGSSNFITLSPKNLDIVHGGAPSDVQRMANRLGQDYANVSI